MNGNPAISYYDDSNDDLKFIRAIDANGSSWGTQTLDSAGNVGWFTSLAMVNGFPAISYYDVSNSNLKFIRATNANGSSWDAPQTLDSAGNVGQYTSLAVINGLPAISYFDDENSRLKFIRATDASGTTWGAPQTLDSGFVGMFTSLAVVDGLPAISYYNIYNNDLKFIRANDANGTSWGTPQTLDSSGSVGRHTSLAVVNGMPAISYYDFTNGDLKFIRAVDASGTSWNTPQTLDSNGDVGYYTSLAVFNGLPAISYYDDTNEDLKFIRADNANGTSWGTPQTLDSSGNVGRYTSLAVFNGLPSISYYDFTNEDLKFIREIGTVDISLWEGTVQINNSDTFNFGSTSLGTPISTPLTIQNNGTIALDLNTISLPNGFSFTGTYPNEVSAGATQVINVRLDALQTGSFSGDLEISNADTNQSPFSIVLEGVVSQDTGGSGGNAESSSVALLPATGFAPGTQTNLPTQPVHLAYDDMDTLTLQIPSLKVDVPIVGVPKTANGWDVTWLTTAQAGWLNGSAYPTWDGNTVLTGHVTNASGNPGPFANIKSLKFGDRLTIQAYGETYTYEVRENKLVTSDDMKVVEEHKSRDWVTLITCEYFNETTGQYLYRRVVRAVLVEVE